MTESQWLQDKNPERMLSWLRGKATDRKWRLFVCALARHVWHLLSEDSRNAVQVAERLADGHVEEVERLAAYEAAGGDWSALFTQADCIPAKALLTENLDYYAGDAAASVTMVADEQGRYILPATPAQVAAENVAQCALLRELFGNPFRPVTVPAHWRTGNVVGLARTAYDDRRFELVPILGDALEDVGCGDEAILAHCRTAEGHVRGCWVVDLLLGRG